MAGKVTSALPLSQILQFKAMTLVPMFILPGSIHCCWSES
jgi:hypothetical protein